VLHAAQVAWQALEFSELKKAWHLYEAKLRQQVGIL
jgi:hypothetical protein